MKHKVVCMDCWKKGVVDVEKGKMVCSKEWHYWGRLNINSCKTDKYVYQVMNMHPFTTKKIKNSCYDPEVKDKFVELWLCDICQYYKKRRNRRTM